MKEIVSLWKAPTGKLARKFTAHGFDPKYFPRDPARNFDGKAYFAKERELAERYEECYGGGVIEVQMFAEDYEAHFQQFEERYQGSSLIQIAVPRDFLAHFNRITVRRIWHHA